MLRNYFKIAWRNLVRHKLNSTINILGLTLGITACLAIFLLSRFEFGYDRFHPDGDRIYRVVGNLHNHEGIADGVGFVPVPLPITMRKELTGLEAVTGFCLLNTKVRIPDAAGRTIRQFDEVKSGEEAVPIVLVEPQYFGILPYRWLAGNAATALNEPFKVVLTEKSASRYFGKDNPANWIGRQIVYHDSLTVTVSGIIKDWNQNTDFSYSDFISYSTIGHSFLQGDIGLNDWNMWDFDSQDLIKLAKGVTPEQVERQLPAFVKAHINLPAGYGVSLTLQPLSDIHFNEYFRDNFFRKANKTSLYGLMGIALFILLIASVNFINLSTAQSVQRSREIGVRKVLGGSRASLISQFMVETLLIVAGAVFVSLCITNPLLSAFHSMLPAGLRLNSRDPFTLLFLAGTVIVTVLLAGWYPARVLASYLPVLSLKGQGIQQLNSRSYLRKSLIVFQFSVSLLFIIATIVIGQQIHYILNKDLGFNKDAILTIQFPFDRPASQRSVFKEKVRLLPDVQMVTMHMESPTAKSHPGTFIERKGAANGKIDASFDMCDNNYVPLYGLKLLAGRNIFPSDTIREYLLNETCARALGFTKPEEALGTLVDCGMNDAVGPVVGIIKDFHSKSLREAITPFFISSNKRSERDISIKLSTQYKTPGHLHEILTQMQRAWASVYPDKKFEYRFLDETIGRLYEKEQKTSMLMNTAMLIAIFISCMGLFGLATFMAEQRTREIGIRKVLGASVSGIVSLLSVDFVKLVLLSILVASPIAWYAMHRWLENFAYRTPISGWVYIGAGLCAILIALLTVSIQAIRAATVNPVKSLRSE